MKVVNTILIFVLFTNVVSGQVDTSQIGVKDGDIFEFVITDDEGIGSFATTDSSGGEIFSIEIEDTNLGSTNKITIKVTQQNGSSEQQENDMLLLGSKILFTDWDYFESFKTFYESLNTENNTLSIENDDNIFTYSSSIKVESVALTTLFTTITTYQKSTGVVRTYESLFSIIIADDINSQSFAYERVDLEDLDVSDSGFLNGLQLGFLLLSSFVVTKFFVRRQVKHRSQN